jgi:hypothetical protein
MKKDITQEAAEAIGIHALSYLMKDHDLIGEFLAVTGLGPKELKSHLQNPAFLGAVLDFLIARAELLSAFAKEHDITPKTVLNARLLLPGADQEFWVYPT